MAGAVEYERDPAWFRRRILFAVAIAITGVVSIGITRWLLEQGPLQRFAEHADRVAAIQLAIFAIAAVETVGRAIRNRYKDFYERPEVVRREAAIRAVLRMVVYGGIGVAIVSILAHSPELAVSVGSFTGLLIGLAAQNTIGNAFAGMVLAIARPFQIGDEVTIMGNTGRIVDIGAMFTRIDAGDSWAVLPNNAILSQAVRAKKRPEDVTGL